MTTEPQAPERTYCTTREAAVLLGVSVGTVQLWTESGVLQAWKTLGGHRRIDRDSVDRLLRRPSGAARDSAAPGQMPTERRPLVMVVEDDRHLLRLYETRLSRWPLAPEVACLDDAVLALLRIGRRRPDMLIVDLTMPHMDGFTMLHSLRHSGEMDGTSIAVVTGLDSAAIEARGGLPGDVAVYPKPIPFDALQSQWCAHVGVLRGGGNPSPGTARG